MAKSWGSTSSMVLTNLELQSCKTPVGYKIKLIQVESCVHAMLTESKPQACKPQELQPLLPACNKPMLLELSASMLAHGFVTLVGCLQWGMHELRFIRTFCVICFLASVGYDALSSALTQPQMHTCWRRGEAQQQHLQKVTWGLALASGNLKSPMSETTV
jgi:hypothetical protein